MSKINVHPDHYKTAGRDRQDDAASARQARAALKASSQKSPDRTAKGPYFQRPEPAQEATPSTTQSSGSATRRRSIAPSTRESDRSAKKKTAVATTRRPTKKR